MRGSLYGYVRWQELIAHLGRVVTRRQRCRLKASRNIGLSATLSARALKLAGSCFKAFFHHHGMSPQRIDASSTPAALAGLTTSTGSVGAML